MVEEEGHEENQVKSEHFWDIHVLMWQEDAAPTRGCSNWEKFMG